MKRKTSAIWVTDKDKLQEIATKNQTISGILKDLGFKVFTAASYVSLKNRMRNDNIDFSHISLGLKTNKNRQAKYAELTKEEAVSKWFKVFDFKYCNRSQLNFIKKFDLIPYICDICHNNGVWQNKTLVLQLDHINGIREDNRLENLRLLCPNCHTQTHNFANKKRQNGR